MFRRGIGFLIVLLLIGAALMGAGGYVGWTQGFAAGSLASGGAVPAYVPYAIGFAPAFLAVGFFFKLIFAVLLIFLLFRFIGFLFWKRGGRGPWGGHGHHRRHEESEGPDEPRDTVGPGGERSPVRL